VEDDFSIQVNLAKRAVDEDRRLVGGFGYVAKRGGVLLHDTQGDSIDGEVLREAVHEFIKSGRHLGIMHIQKDGKPVAGGEIVEMAVFSGDFRPPGMDPDIDALWIVAKVSDDDVWAMVKMGAFTGFSIGGKGLREEIE
jgi:hypothetical protein